MARITYKKRATGVRPNKLSEQEFKRLLRLRDAGRLCEDRMSRDKTPLMEDGKGCQKSSK